VFDDLGFALGGRGPRRRIVSLVPSLTESVAGIRPAALVGATDWCSRPAQLDVVRVRGTKNPDVAKIVGLRPDLVLANKEENRRRDVEALRAAGVPVWVTVIETVDQALASLQRMFIEALEWPEPDWLTRAAALWATFTPRDPLRVAVPIWRDPWMVVGRDTFTGDLLARLGLVNVFAGADNRYPHVSVDEIRSAGADVILLPDEPYRFTAIDGPEQFPDVRCALIEGRALTWYGPSLLTAPGVVKTVLA
jgi:ABC-type Fe3+-hydroxamate transport system substrate-binding protein